MEKFNLQCCSQLSNASHFDNTEQKPVKPEIKREEMTSDHTNKPVQKPWSVFEGVYWI